MKKYKISELGHTITGTTPQTADYRNYSNDDYLFISPTDIKFQRYITKTEKHISNFAFNNLQLRQMSFNDIVIDCIGSDMGNVAIINEPCISNQQINAITNINQKEFSSLYLYYLFCTMKSYFHQIGMNGSTMPIISKSLFDEIEISIHDFPEQQHIVNNQCYYSSLFINSQIFASNSLSFLNNSLNSPFTFFISASTCSGVISLELSIPTYLPGTRE